MPDTLSIKEKVEKNFAKPAGLSKEAAAFIEETWQFQEIMMMYNSAIREVRTKLEILNDDLAMRNSRNPIEFITQRVKKPVSIIQKLQRNGWEVSAPSIVEHLNDVAGIRVICSFIDDIYEVAEMLGSQDDVTVIKVKDYIKNPKPNGYRSYHMIIEIPVFFSDRTQSMRVEIQIRTIAMDFWASLEHQLKYKKMVANEEEIYNQLAECATTIAQVDQKMQDIRKQIENSSDSSALSAKDKLERLGNGLMRPGTL